MCLPRATPLACARLAQAQGYDEVNLNVGCPSDRVQNGRFGACLMGEPALVADCVKAMRDVVDPELGFNVVDLGLLYGVLLCGARAMGEFGAVSVVSGHIRGETNTIPLLVEIFYNEYNFTGAFALSGVLALLALATLAVQNIITKLQDKKLAAAERNAA